MRKSFRGLMAAMVVALPVLATAADEPTSKKFGDWIFIQLEDPMTDAKKCFLSYAREKAVTFNVDNAFRINYKGRGGVTLFQYRFGKASASEPESVKDYEGDVITIPALLIEVFDQPTLRVTGEKVVGGGINLEISLKGLKEGREAMAKSCDVADLPSIADGKRAWANWQVTPATTSK